MILAIAFPSKLAPSGETASPRAPTRERNGSKKVSALREREIYRLYPARDERAG